MGTPEAAVPTLERLAAAGDLGLVVTRPDRPRGRSLRPQPSPVKQAAEKLGIRVAQPASRGDLEGVIAAAGPVEVAVVVAFGMIIPPAALAVASRGFLNVHFSLLPRWRGASPVAAALMAGDEVTGVTIIQLDEGLDTGPVVASQPVVIAAEETAGELTRRLAEIGAQLIADVLPAYLAGGVPLFPQPTEGATYARRLNAGDRRLDVNGPASEFVNRVRALSPSPGAQLEMDGVVNKILGARSLAGPATAGTVLSDHRRVLVGVGGRMVEILHIQPPGRRVMTAEEWLRGLREPPHQAR